MSGGSALWRAWETNLGDLRDTNNVYRQATWAECRFQTELDTWLRNENAGLVLAGDPEQGKTMSLVLVAVALKSLNVAYECWSSRQLFEWLRDPANKGTKVWRELVSSPYLLIDDLGREYSTEWRDDRFDEIVMERHANQRPMIVTTNLSFKVMTEIGWGRINWRLRDLAKDGELWIETGKEL